MKNNQQTCFCIIQELFLKKEAVLLLNQSAQEKLQRLVEHSCTQPKAPRSEI